MQSPPEPDVPLGLMLNPWSLPFLLWDGWVKGWQRSFSAEHHTVPTHPHDQGDDQLEVPDPIEDDGEHALFA